MIILQKQMKRLWKDERGIGTLETILIIAIIVILAVAFRKWIIKWVNDLFTKTNENMNKFNTDNGIQTPTTPSS